jgi:phosphoglycolate phosphatase
LWRTYYDDVDILLDLDGTLSDPRPGFVASINHALHGLGLPVLPEPDIARHIGPPLEETLALLLGPAHAPKLSAAVALYRERYADRGIFECSLYEGIPDALRQLQAAGRRLFLATSKPHPFARRILRHFDLEAPFSGIYGAELDGTRADKRQLLAHLLEQERLQPQAAVMVGDRAQDVRAAKHHGMRSLGVLWGYGSRHELVTAGASALTESPSQLLDALTKDRWT